MMHDARAVPGPEEKNRLRALEEQAAACLQKASQGCPGLSIALSGGLDSRLLIHLAQRAGVEVTACHLAGPHVPPAETAFAKRWAAERGIPLRMLQVDVLEDAQVAANGPERCYFCKRRLFSTLQDAVGDQPLCDGTNASDHGLYRPGLKALHELGILSPLAEAGLFKDDIRALARFTGLEAPGQRARPCLLTRFQYGLRPTHALLARLAVAEAAIAGILERHGLTAGPAMPVAEEPARAEPADFRLRVIGENAYALHLALPEIPAAALRELEAALMEHGFPGASLAVMETVSGHYDRQRAQPEPRPVAV